MAKKKKEDAPASDLPASDLPAGTPAELPPVVAEEPPELTPDEDTAEDAPVTVPGEAALAAEEPPAPIVEAPPIPEGTVWHFGQGAAPVVEAPPVVVVAPIVAEEAAPVVEAPPVVVVAPIVEIHDESDSDDMDVEHVDALDADELSDEDELENDGEVLDRLLDTVESLCTQVGTIAESVGRLEAGEVPPDEPTIYAWAIVVDSDRVPWGGGVARATPHYLTLLVPAVTDSATGIEYGSRYLQFPTASVRRVHATTEDIARAVALARYVSGGDMNEYGMHAENLRQMIARSTPAT